MSAKTIRSALGLLQDDPESEKAWEQLRAEIGSADLGMTAEELAKLLEAARRAHEMRREYEAVASMLEIEVQATKDTERKAELQAALARVLDEELLDDERSTLAYMELLDTKPGDTVAEEAIERSEAKRKKWTELVDRYVAEARAAGEPSFKSSLLVSAAEVAYRFGRPALARANEKGAKKKLQALGAEIVGGLREALEIDPRNRRASQMLEHVLRVDGRWDELAALIEKVATDVPAKDEKIAGFVRLARVLEKKLGSPERAAAAYERVIDLAPGHAEATSRLVEFFSEREMWDHLVALYEEQLRSGARAGQEVGIVLQIAMVSWKMRGRPEAAEPYFEKLRKSEPAHPGMIAFFREWCAAKGEQARLAAILADAQRAMPDGPERAQLGAEIAKLAEEGANAQKAIDQWRAILRQDSANKDAREALKRLYRQTGNYNALADLLRGELEKLGPDDAARLPILRDIATVYRDHLKSDTALVTVLAQLSSLDPNDADSLRELARVYEALQRWRDLLAVQGRLAELEKNAGVRGELYRAIARRWLEQFSNVQNAVEAYEKLHQAEPVDREAIDKLKELYAKRRAYKPLYDLLEEESAAMDPGPARREIWSEMAKIAAERLDKGPDATRLYKKILDEDSSASAALDALEKQAERDKDFATVADVLERRVAAATDDATRLAVLQKLGGVYSDRLHDHPGAMKAWRRVLAIQPGHAKALRVLRDSHLAIGDFDGLTELYAQSSDWEGLVEVVSGAADRAVDPTQKVELSFRAAEIYESKLGAPERAFRAYERVLGVEQDNERAARALVPLYEKDEKWGRLPALYEVLLARADETDEKLALLAKLVEVTGHQLQDRGAAFVHARRAYEVAPDREGALEALEKAARASAKWAELVDVLVARQKSKKAKKEEKRLLRAKLAEIYGSELGRVDEAVATYRALVEEDETDEAAVATLDRILRSTDRRDDLRWLFDVRIGRANTAAKLDLLTEWATIEEETFAEPTNATALYRRILEIVSQHGGALRALARLLKSSGDASGAVEVLERDRDQREGADRAAREIELARLYMSQLKRPNDALAAAKRALEIAPHDPSALAVVEELLQVGETRARAAAILEVAYAETGNAQRQAEVLEVMIAAAAAHADRLALYQRLADVYEKKLRDLGAAFDVLSRAVDTFPMDLELWDRLAVLSNRTSRFQRFVDAIVAALPPAGETSLPEAVEIDLAERAATLFEEKLGEVDRARPYLERILARDPSNERAFHRLKQILTTREQWHELEEMYERAVAATPEPSRRAELLAEVALVAEEITGERPKAIRYYERILELDPLHEQAARSLDALYAAESRWDALAKLLERRLATATGEETLALKLRLGTLFYSRLADPASALGHLEEVLREMPANNEARQLVERILDVPELRARAAAVLEGVYYERDEIAELVRVLEVRLELSPLDGPTAAADRRELLRRIAELRDERLRDDAGAFEAFARLVPLDADDVRARTRMLEIARRLGAHERVAAVLTQAAANATSPLPRAEILTDVAKIYEDYLDDSARAEDVYVQVLDIASDDAAIALPASRSLERIYAAAGKNADLARILRVEVKLEDNVEARRELWGRLGELSETVLDDTRGAVEAWRARLDEDPIDERALVALDRLYERTGDWKALVEVLRTRERQANDRDSRKTLMVRLATTLAEKLTDVPEAILAYRAIVDDFGAERSTLASLATLYEIADRWQDYAETLEAELGLAETAADRLTLLARLGVARETKLGDVAGAIEAYRQALTLDPSHAPSRAALEAMLGSEAARREAAAILRPLYEADGEQLRLLRVLDIEAEYADSPEVKLGIFAQAASVAEGPLGDPARAFEYASRGMREAVGEPELPTWLERAERLAASTGRFAELVELLKGTVGEILDGEIQLDVTRRIAELARARLGDVALARAYYAKALELRSDDRKSLVALESLYEETNDAPALLDILKRRAESADSDAERKALLFKEARLSDKTGDAQTATTVYEQILEIGMDRDAIAALERLYSTTERWDDLFALYERQIAASDVSAARRAELHHLLGAVLEKRLKEIDRAFDEYAKALEIDAHHAPTVASLEALMEERASHAVTARAAEMLEAVYLSRLDWRKVMSAIEARLEASEDPDDRRQLLRRLAKLYEEQEENYRAALETMAKLLTEDVTDESTWAELERLARVANAEGRLAEIYAGELEKVQSDEPATAKLSDRAGELFEAQGNSERALVFYRRAYAFDPEAEQGAFEAIDRLLREANRPRDRVTLYREALDFRNDPNERLTTLHTIALLEEAELHDDAAAIDTYRAALDIDEEDRHALEALARLLARTERWRELADMTRRRAEQTALPEDEARFRMELGKLLGEKLGDVSGAIDEYQTVVELVPGAKEGPGAEAVKALEALLHVPEHRARVVEMLRPIYERADDWRNLVEVNRERLDLATDAGEKVTVLRETARLWEERGRDIPKAFAALREAFVLDPEDGGTREELDRLGAAIQRWDELAETYEAAIAKTEGLTERELLGALARLHDQRRDDPRRALEAWDRLFKLDETDLAPLEEMDAHATLLSDWPTLVRVLAKKAEIVADDETRASTWRRIGEARRDMLDDLAGAIDAYERALELEPASAFTLDNLIALYETKNDAARLVDLYRRRVELCGEDDEGLKFQLLVDAANRYETGLGDRREAIQVLTDALAVKPGDGEVTRRLDGLYAAEKMWPELLDNLRLQASSAEDPAAKRALEKRIGALLATELDDPQQALDAYRAVLESGFDEDAATAIRAIGEARDELRAEAADALEPVLRGAGRYADLADVLEMRLRAQTDPADRAATLRAIAGVAESHLGDARRAEAALLRALAEEPGDASLHAEIERLAGQLGEEGWRRYADAIGERAAAIFDATITTDLYARLGKVAEEHLRDDARAAKAYVAAAERAGDDALVLGALDRLFGRLGDARALADVLERRVAIDADGAAQAELFHRLASLQITEFGEKAHGLATLRLALERVPDHAASREAIEGLLDDDTLFDEAFEALELVYRTLGRSEDLARLFERRVARATGARERTRARLELARVIEEHVRDGARAQRVVEAALDDDAADEDALAELERLAPTTNGWREASDALARALDKNAHGRADVPRGTQAELWARLAGWRRDKTNDPRGAEEAYAKALELDAENVELLRALEDLRRAPGRERDLVATLRARAKLEGDVEAKRELLREAKGLAETTVGDAALAEATLRDLLAEHEGDLWALEELTRLREAAGDHADVVTLLLKRAELVPDGAQALELKHRAASVVTDPLDDKTRAISLYEEILEAEPSDARAAASLRTLYGAAGLDEDLGKLLSRLIDVATSAGERSTLRLELAGLQATKFKAHDDAIDTLRSVLDEDPGNAEAVVRLSQLYEQTGKDAELAELLRTQLDAAQGRGDVATELTLLVRLGEMYEGRLNDSTAAQECYEKVLEREPTHRGALEAIARMSEARAAWDRASGALEKLVELSADSTGVGYALRLAAVREKLDDAVGVEAALKRAIALEPGNEDVRTRLKALYEKGKKWQELADLLVGDADLVAAANPDAKPPAAPPPGASLPPPGGSMAPVGPIGEQVKLLRRAAEIHLTQRQSPQDAIPILERAAALVPHDRALLLVLCDAYNASERGRDAASVLEKVIASFGNKRTKELALYHHRLGRALAQLGDKDVALAQYDMAFKIDPGSVSVLRDLGVLALETNDLDRAQKTFRALLLQRLDPALGISKGEVFYYLGEISAKQGDKTKAVQMLERAIENEPTLDKAKAKLSELKS